MWSISLNTERNWCCTNTGMPRDTTCISTHSNHPPPTPAEGEGLHSDPAAAPRRLDFLRVGVGGGGGTRGQESASFLSNPTMWVWSEQISSQHLVSCCTSCKEGGTLLVGVASPSALGTGWSEEQLSCRALRQSRALSLMSL